MPRSWKASKMAMFSSWVAGMRSVGVFEMDPDGEVERAVAVGLEQDLGRRFGHHPGVGPADPVQHPGHLVHVRVIGHPHLQGEAVDAGAVVGPVEDLVGDQVRVGNDEHRVVKVFENRAADPDFLDPAPLAVDDQEVPHLDGPLEEEDQAADRNC